MSLRLAGHFVVISEDFPSGFVLKERGHCKNENTMRWEKKHIQKFFLLSKQHDKVVVFTILTTPASSKLYRPLTGKMPAFILRLNLSSIYSAYHSVLKHL